MRFTGSYGGLRHLLGLPLAIVPFTRRPPCSQSLHPLLCPPGPPPRCPSVSTSSESRGEFPHLLPLLTISPALIFSQSLSLRLPSRPSIPAFPLTHLVPPLSPHIPPSTPFPGPRPPGSQPQFPSCPDSFPASRPSLRADVRRESEGGGGRRGSQLGHAGLRPPPCDAWGEGPAGPTSHRSRGAPGPWTLLTGTREALDARPKQW